MNKDKIKKLVHGNFRCYFSQTKPCVGIVEIINIPIYLNGELSLCTFRSEVFDKELKSKLIFIKLQNAQKHKRTNIHFGFK